MRKTIVLTASAYVILGMGVSLLADYVVCRIVVYCDLSRPIKNFFVFYSDGLTGLALGLVLGLARVRRTYVGCVLCGVLARHTVSLGLLLSLWNGRRVGIFLWNAGLSVVGLLLGYLGGRLGGRTLTWEATRRA